MTKMQRAMAYALLATLLWSTVATAFKLGLRYFDHHIGALLGWSVLMAVSCLSIIAFFRLRKDSWFPGGMRPLLRSAILGALNPFAYYLILFKAYDLLPASEAQPLNYTWPIMLSVLSALVFRHRIRLVHLLSMLMGLAGVMVIATRGQGIREISDPLGVGLAAGSSLVWAVYWIGNMRDQRPALQKMIFNLLFGLFYLFLYLFIRGDIFLPSYSGMICAFWIGLGEMGLTFVIWMRALELAPAASSISHVVYLSPFISLLFLHALLGEQVVLSSVGGLCLIISGIFVALLNKKQL
ncbi:DMT family transporter [bacterium]|nr:DMT family transporter [bacterium]